MFKKGNSLHEITGQGVSLVDFGAAWCGPCKAQGPVIKKVAEKFEGRAAVKEVDIDRNRDLAMDLGIQSVPTLIVFKDGREVERFIGLQNENKLTQALNTALE
ncbi:MAG: thioredoxin [Desulfohalobiaceae bacterium]|nr:thioredoxin [Desulfohalobiaceae bacterium]